MTMQPRRPAPDDPGRRSPTTIQSCAAGSNICSPPPTDIDLVGIAARRRGSGRHGRTRAPRRRAHGPFDAGRRRRRSHPPHRDRRSRRAHRRAHLVRRRSSYHRRAACRCRLATCSSTPGPTSCSTRSAPRLGGDVRPRSEGGPGAARESPHGPGRSPAQRPRGRGPAAGGGRARQQADRAASSRSANAP